MVQAHKLIKQLTQTHITTEDIQGHSSPESNTRRTFVRVHEYEVSCDASRVTIFQLHFIFNYFIVFAVHVSDHR
jgi:hypothetical protein